MSTPNTPASNDFVLVPRVPSDEMALAIVRELGRQQSYLGWEPHGIWTAALAAAPASPEPITTEVVKDRLTTEALDKPASETEA